MNRILCCLMLAWAGSSAASEAPESSVIPASRDTQQLRYRAFETLATAAVLSDAHETPLADRLDLQVSQAGLSERRLRSINIAIDDASAEHFELSASEATAIAQFDELRRIARQTIAPGLHTAHVTFGVVDSARPDRPLREVAADLRFEKKPGPLDLELRFDPGVLIGSSIKTRVHQRRDEPPRKLLGVALDLPALPGASDVPYRSGGTSDPAVSYAQHLLRTNDPEKALVELLKTQQESGPQALAADYWLVLAQTLRTLGLLDRAEAICDQLDRTKGVRDAVAVERLQLAQAHYAAGDLDRAEAQLAAAQAFLPEVRRADWRYAEGMVLIARQRPAEAAAMLGQTNSETIDAYRFMDASTEALRATAYGRFNLAVAMVQSGDVTRGLSWLDLIGRSNPGTPEMLALRDQANLALGWHFLEAKQGRTALGVLGRVRSEGPLSNRALLGMGWAQLAPNGERLPRVQLAVLPPRAPDQISDLPAPLKNSLARLRVLEPELHGAVGPRSFERDDPPKDREQGLRRALTIWETLMTRDEREPAVLEAMLAMAYAHDQLGEQGQARAAYAKAVDSLHRGQGEIADDKSFVASGGLTAALQEATDARALFQLMDRLHLPPDDHTQTLYGTLEAHRATASLEAALQKAQARLVQTMAPAVANDQPADADAAIVVTAVEPYAAPVLAQAEEAAVQLRAERVQLEAEAMALSTQNLDHRNTMLARYLKSALLLAARVEDQPAIEERIGSR